MLDPKKIRTKIKEDKKNDIINFLNKFCESFSCTVMNGIYETISKSNNLSHKQIELISKRMNSIKLLQVTNPEKYLEKYWKLMVPIFSCINYNEVAHIDSRKLDGFKEFFRAFGYLSKEQCKFIVSLLSLSENRLINKIKKDIKTRPFRKEYKEAYDLVTSKFKEGVVERIVPSISDDENPFMKFFVETHKRMEEEAKKKKVEYTQIPQEFLSLREMRARLECS